MKLRRMVSAVPKPQRAAIATTVSSVCSNWRRAASVRTRSTYCAGRLADLVGEHPGEMPRAHRGKAGQFVDAVRATGLRLDGFLHLADRLALGAGHPHRRGELRLPTGPAQVHHEPAGDRLSDLGAVVVLDKGEREVDSRSDTGGCPYLLASYG